jgi:hypothetical protein
VDPEFKPQYHKKKKTVKLGMVVYVYNPRPWEAETGES